MAAAAADPAAAAVPAGIAVVRCQAGQCGGLGGAGGSEFGQVGAQAGGIERAAARDRQDDCAAAAERGVGLEAGLQGLVGLLELIGT